MDKSKIEQGVRLIIEGIGEDPERVGLKNTPQRVAEMYQDLFRGVENDLETTFKTYPVENQDEMILMKDIPFYSFCEHHLLPFWGSVSLAYIPNNNRIAGFSTLIKVVEHFAHQPQIQERMTTQICDFLNGNLKPAGLLVVIRAHHLCISMRGVKKEQSEAITSAMRGYLRKQATRLEALNLLKER
ncbi:MAG: GTP cyclohydrolase I FolE [Candidatus Electryonea clarkiae]|nr:GTP cyclohydrolase I FolE [Candidatus Electryonea clarkiae]MDP8289056.1 GTP cyclohydrolase I FolE [Candidatus Electryonea clarkiae]